MRYVLAFFVRLRLRFVFLQFQEVRRIDLCRGLGKSQTVSIKLYS